MEKDTKLIGMPDIQWLIATDIIKSIFSIFSILVCGYMLQREFGDPIKSGRFSTMAKSFGAGFGFMGISFLLSLLAQNYVLRFINEWHVIDETGSLFRAYFLMTMIFFYYPLFFIVYTGLRIYNGNLEKKEDADLGRPLYK
jgi:amino acid permease